MKGHAGIMLLLGLSGLALGLGITVLPFSVPYLPFWLWGVCYWCGGTLMVLGGLTADITLLQFVLRRLLGGSRRAARG